jgi:hypothetical protein
VTVDGLACALAVQVGAVLRAARLGWRQLSSVRVFFDPDLLEGAGLGALVASALVASSGGEEGAVPCALTLVPVAALPGEDLLLAQVVALDVEKLRSEAWAEGLDV